MAGRHLVMHIAMERGKDIDGSPATALKNKVPLSATAD
jgi:hypothetical protein